MDIIVRVAHSCQNAKFVIIITIEIIMQNARQLEHGKDIDNIRNTRKLNFSLKNVQLSSHILASNRIFSIACHVAEKLIKDA